MSVSTDDITATSPDGTTTINLTPRQETAQWASEVDGERAKVLLASGLPGASLLATGILPPSLPYDAPVTLASARHFLRMRECFASDLDGAFYYEEDETVLMTIVPPGWAVGYGRLDSFSPVAKLKGFAAQMNDIGLINTGGPVVAAVNGEANASLGIYQLYLRLVTTPRAAALIMSRLCAHPAYLENQYVQRPIATWDPVNPGAAGAAAFCFQSYTLDPIDFWSRNNLLRNRAVQLKPPCPQRLSEVLLWLDKMHAGNLLYTAGAKLSLGLRRL